LVEALARLGPAQPAAILPVRNREQAYIPDSLRKIQEATGIYFCGGNQVRITAALGGTPLENALMSAYQRGAVVAGSSAGAAALCSVMLAYGKSGASPRQGMAQLVSGLGFESGVIFDQHFRQRDRLGRLIFAILNNPRLLGVGVDENTAAVLEDGRLRVLGKNAVTLVDGAALRANDVAEVEGKDALAAGPLTVHVLTDGFVYDIRNRRLLEIPLRRSESN
jgi:cyanophycinase